MRLKIHDGTVDGSNVPLCQSCRHAVVVRGARLNDEVVECRMLDEPRRISFPVRFCSVYVNRNHPTIREMEEIAWVLRSDAHRKTVGFVPSRKLKSGERFVLDDD